MSRLRNTYAAAVTRGTAENNRRQATEYLTFCYYNGVDYMNPSALQVALFTQSLAGKFKTAGAALNYVAGACKFVRHSGGRDEAFDTYLVKTVKKGVTRLGADHQPNQSPAFNPRPVAAAAGVLQGMGLDGKAAAAALLLGYASFLRPSNIFFTRSGGEHAGHTLRRRDIVVTTEGLRVYVTTTKSTRIPYSLPIMESAGPGCPVRAWKLYVAAAPSTPEAVILTNSLGRPYTAQNLTPLVRAALATTGHKDALAFTFHGPRRSGANTAADSGATEAQVRRHGRWKSRAVYKYVPRKKFKN